MDNKNFITNELNASAISITTKCRDCGNEFTIEADEAKWYEEKGYALPHRCSECRKKRRIERKENRHKRRSALEEIVAKIVLKEVLGR